MTRYIAILCNKCKKPIGTGAYLKYYDEESGLTFYWHTDLINNCAEKVKQAVVAEYLEAIAHAKQRRVK